MPGAQLFRTNREIYEELSEAFYSSEVFNMEIHGHVREYNTKGCVDFMQRSMDLRGHALRTLHISIDFTLTLGVYPKLKPQNISPSQVLRFLAAPVQSLSVFGLPGEPFKLTVTGEEGQPLPEMSDQVMKTLLNRFNNGDLRPMIRYFRVLRVTLDVAGYVALGKFWSASLARRDGEVKEMRLKLLEYVGYLTDCSEQVMELADASQEHAPKGREDKRVGSWRKGWV
ncbi:hypothetical protein B0A55_04091 [Friedmanniomyces simplex]|uniref:Uncharacterized protein n=1 Tax=Friedmanniomyces simplex TaxID=329884 RepID=A0A4U0XV71_9PEZI|nr:hypothetical protein B0A55_04091 [Friedmanniomyces simplex]